MKRFCALVLCLLIILSDQAKATVVFTDSFTVEADINLNAYPSGSPNWAMNLGAATDLQVIASSDTLESMVDTDAIARITAAGIPTGDQEITASLSTSPAGAVGLAGRCNTSGTANCYTVSFAPGSDLLVFYRVDNGTFNQLGADCTGRVFTEVFTGRFKITGTGATVNLEAQADATTVCTYADTDANRKTSGTPGLSNQGSGPAAFDNVSVDNLAAANSPLPIILSRRKR